LKRWSEDEDALICKLRREGAGIAEIAPRLPHRTREAVDRRIRLLIRNGRVERLRSEGSGHHPWTQSDEELVMQLRDAGAKLDDIVAQLPHRTRRSVEDRIRELIDAGTIERTIHSPQSHRAWSPEEDELVAAMRRADKTMEEMAKALDRSLASVNGRIAQRVRKGELPLLRANPRDVSQS
jgi:DNA-binding HxlR family transcriptional regulator